MSAALWMVDDANWRERVEPCRAFIGLMVVSIARRATLLLAASSLWYHLDPMSTLDASQRAFVEAPEGHIRLLAPAGCGKTRCLLERCSFLLNSTVFAPNFLIVTFTKAAQQELEQRVSSDPSFSALKGRTTIRTLNAWGWQRFSSSDPKPKLLTRRRDLVAAANEHLGQVWQLHEGIRLALAQRRLSVSELSTLLDELKSLGFIHARHRDFQSFTAHLDTLQRFGMVPYVREKIVEPLEQANLIDERGSSEDKRRQFFDSFYRFWLDAVPVLPTQRLFTFEDQKYWAYLGELRLLPDGFPLHGHTHYEHILVDEFQDINPLDLGLIRAIRDQTNATLTIVGDDDQAIYEWRGGTPEYILNPAKAFNIAFKTMTLDVNYRSPANIIEHSQRLISHNERREPKNIRPGASSPRDADVQLIHPESESDAWEHLRLIIDDAISKGTNPSRIAVLTRQRRQLVRPQLGWALTGTHFAAAPDQQLARSNVWGQVLEAIRILSEREELAGPEDIVAQVEQVLRLAGGFGPSDFAVARMIERIEKPRLQSMKSAVPMLGELVGRLRTSGRASAKERMIQTAAIAAARFIEAPTVSRSIEVMKESFIGLKENQSEAERDIWFADPPLADLASFGRQFGTCFRGFADDVDRAMGRFCHDLTGRTVEQGVGSEHASEALQIMTAHRAKGKEFDVVALLGVVEGIWPSASADTASELEAERRVFYVAFTRVQKRIIMFINGSDNVRQATPSPYLAELGLPK